MIGHKYVSDLMELDRQKIEDTKDIILKDTTRSLDTLRCQDDT